MVLRYRDGHGNVTGMGTKEGKFADVRKRLDREAVTGEVTNVPETVTDAVGSRYKKHDCPACGATHRVKVYESQADKQKAYRDKRK